MQNRLLMTICLLALWGCGDEREPTKHVFYLHGMIIETQGIYAVSKEFGPYEYTRIVDSLGTTGVQVYSEVRTKETDFDDFSKKISGQIDSLVKKGVPPSDITVIGASKGGMLAMNISTINKNAVKYVLLGANSPHTETTFNFNLHGHILGIYEASDAIAPNDYRYWMERSPEAQRFEQLQLHTGLGHGFLYRPIDAWLAPARDWIITE